MAIQGENRHHTPDVRVHQAVPRACTRGNGKDGLDREGRAGEGEFDGGVQVGWGEVEAWSTYFLFLFLFLFLPVLVLS